MFSNYSFFFFQFQVTLHLVLNQLAVSSLRWRVVLYTRSALQLATRDARMNREYFWSIHVHSWQFMSRRKKAFNVNLTQSVHFWHLALPATFAVGPSERIVPPFFPAEPPFSRKWPPCSAPETPFLPARRPAFHDVVPNFAKGRNV